MALEEIRRERIAKAERLREHGLDPYPAEVARTHSTSEVEEKFSSLEKGKKTLSIAGRIMARREHGGATFVDLADESGTIQAFLKEDVLEAKYRLFLDTVDIGDFVAVTGRAFTTKRGEHSIEVASWSMIAKSLRPLPEKWHGLQDVEERFRKRYLDLLMNEDVRRRFLLRSTLVSKIRSILEKNGFLEVETPMLHPLPGGALARPFRTHHNALDVDFFLRIAPELYLKRLLVGGFGRVYEIGKNFRNEGIDLSHNPEFTMLELYAAYWNEEDMMDFTETFFVSLAKETAKKGELTLDGKTIAFKKPFARISFLDLLKRYALIPDYEKETRDSLIVRGRQLGIDISPNETKGKIADEIYKKICRPYLVQPTFVTAHPLDISPLAKKYSDKKNEVRRFQLVAGGIELTNGFAELNDPLEQRKRFEEQTVQKEKGDDEAHPVDEEFIEALEYGMPPAAGMGIGIDRLLMLFSDAKNIREVVLFPTLKPRVILEKKDEEKKQ